MFPRRSYYDYHSHGIQFWTRYRMYQQWDIASAQIFNNKVSEESRASDISSCSVCWQDTEDCICPFSSVRHLRQVKTREALSCRARLCCLHLWPVSGEHLINVSPLIRLWGAPSPNTSMWETVRTLCCCVVEVEWKVLLGPSCALFGTSGLWAKAYSSVNWQLHLGTGNWELRSWIPWITIFLQACSWNGLEWFTM